MSGINFTDSNIPIHMILLFKRDGSDIIVLKTNLPDVCNIHKESYLDITIHVPRGLGTKYIKDNFNKEPDQVLQL